MTMNISNNYSEIGGLDFFLAHISDCLPYVILVSLGSVIGVIGNLIIMLTIITNRELHSPTYMLMFNLAIADILVSGFTDSTTVFSVFVGENYFINRPSFCIFIGFICFIGCNVSELNIGFLAINRYINICHNNLYTKVFTKKLTLLYCLITWILGFLNNVPNIAGWSNFIYDTKTLSCIWNRLAALSYDLYLDILCVMLPCGAIFLCYMKIFIFAYKSKNKSKSSSLDQSIRLAKGLFGSFMLYVVCMIPMGVTFLIDFFFNNLPMSAIMYSQMLSHLNSSLNPILYAVYNSSFRHGSLNLFNKICCCVTLFCKPRNNNVTPTGNLQSSANINILNNVNKRNQT